MISLLHLVAQTLPGCTAISTFRHVSLHGSLQFARLPCHLKIEGILSMVVTLFDYLNLYYAGLFQVDISSDVYTYWQ